MGDESGVRCQETSWDSEGVGDARADDEPVLFPVETALVRRVIVSELGLNLDSGKRPDVEGQRDAGDRAVRVRRQDGAVGTTGEVDAFQPRAILVVQVFGPQGGAELGREVIPYPAADGPKDRVVPIGRLKVEVIEL